MQNFQNCLKPGILIFIFCLSFNAGRVKGANIYEEIDSIYIATLWLFVWPTVIVDNSLDMFAMGTWAKFCNWGFQKGIDWNLSVVKYTRKDDHDNFGGKLFTVSPSLLEADSEVSKGHLCVEKININLERMKVTPSNEI